MSDINNESVVEQKYEDAVDEIKNMTVDEFLTLCRDWGFIYTIYDILPSVDYIIDTVAKKRANEK
jgi:hypothetical protein|tara:strand:- start:606 stop:800 length:195 start_codon:yes stop_codon:yes gene_type:complete